MNQQNEQDKTPIRGWKQLTGKNAGKMIDPKTMEPIEEGSNQTSEDDEQVEKASIKEETNTKTIEAVEINYKVNEQEIKVNSKDINQLFSDIERYNHQFSLGFMMARSIFGLFEPGENEAKKRPGEILNEEHNNQQIDAFFLISQHKKILENIGLSLEPVSGGPSISISGEDGEAQEVEAALNIKNEDHFIAFLSELKPEQIESAGLKPNLEKIIPMLSRQIKRNYDLVIPREEPMEIFSGMKRIIEEYKRLEMSESVTELEEYYKHGMAGNLREYLIIERRGLLSPPGKFFGPADWQRDSSPKDLERKWYEATFILNHLKEEPKTINLYEKLAKHLYVCVNHAIESLEEMKRRIPDSIEDIEEFRNILEAAKQKIEEIGK
jgi:hypothetical protein